MVERRIILITFVYVVVGGRGKQEEEEPVKGAYLAKLKLSNGAKR